MDDLMKKKKFDKEAFLKKYDLENLSKRGIENLLKKELNKEQLLLIAEKCFGIPRGSNLRLPKKEILDLIRSVINHDESMEAIRRKAAEP